MAPADPLKLLTTVLAALGVMVAFQVIRLQQTTAEGWLVADYAGRLLSLAIVATVPGVRPVAFTRQRLAISGEEAGAWIAGLIALEVFVLEPLRAYFGPALRLAYHVALNGPLLFVDAAFGLILVAIHEEIFFRRLARALLQPAVGDGFAMIAISAIAFGLFHWQFGVGNILAAIVFGAFAMAFYKRSGSIAPLVAAHYLADLCAFVL